MKLRCQWLLLYLSLAGLRISAAEVGPYTPDASATVTVREVDVRLEFANHRTTSFYLVDGQYLKYPLMRWVKVKPGRREIGVHVNDRHGRSRGRAFFDLKPDRTYRIRAVRATEDSTRTLAKTFMGKFPPRGLAVIGDENDPVEYILQLLSEKSDTPLQETRMKLTPEFEPIPKEN